MKSYLAGLLCCAALVILAGCAMLQPEGGREGVRAITPDLLRAHVTYLASDAMKGRNTPSPELDSAAEYIARQLREIGVAPVNGSYFQRVPLNIIALGEGNALVLSRAGMHRSYEIKTEFVPFEMTASDSVTAPLVFAGYGITAPEYGYDDYAGLDVRGKVVLVLAHEPGEQDASSPFAGREATAYSTVGTKVRIAREHGAAALLLATDPLNHLLLSPRGFPWPSLSRIIPADALPMTLADDEAAKIPTVHVGPAFIESLFGSMDSLRAIQRALDAGKKPAAYRADGTVSVRTTTAITDRSTSNVVGLIEGADPVLRNEVVVIGAHYDHVGVKKNVFAGQDSIYNGADDNASGTAAVMAVAAAFRAAGARPRRSVLFLFFAGEEKGLFGSQAYTRAPLLPLDSTVAMINMDMVGRAHDTLYVVGVSRSPDLVRINEEENHDTRFTLMYNAEQFLGRSDQASFLKEGIPVLFLHTGEHADYHKVTDEASRIDFDKVARVARLAYLDAWRIANESVRYRITDGTVSLF